MTTLLRGSAAVILAAAPVLGLVPASHALSCVGPDQVLADAQHVFVGRISDARADSVQLAVTEVWKGADLAPHVWLERQRELDLWLPFADVDGEVPDGYSSPELYLVAVDAEQVVGPCGLWPREDLDELGVAVPDRVRPPAADGLDGEEPGEGLPVAPGVAAGAGVAGIGAVAAVLWRRRRS